MPRFAHCHTDRLHTDKCAALQSVDIGTDGEVCATEAHPIVSSVLYLTDEGGPTVVFDQTLERSSDSTAAESVAEAWPEAPAQALVCAPAKNRMLLFDGRLLHGVLHRPGGPAASLRRTLLINWWAHRPPGVADAPREFARGRPAGVGATGSKPIEQPELPELVLLPHAPASALARFCEDARAHWILQRAPPEVGAAYAASVCAGRAPLLLVAYDSFALTPDAATAVATPDGRPRRCDAVEGACHVVAASRLSRAHQQSVADDAITRGLLRAIWPP